MRLMNVALRNTSHLSHPNFTPIIFSIPLQTFGHQFVLNTELGHILSLWKERVVARDAMGCLGGACFFKTQPTQHRHYIFPIMSPSRTRCTTYWAILPRWDTLCYTQFRWNLTIVTIQHPTPPFNLVPNQFQYSPNLDNFTPRNV